MLEFLVASHIYSCVDLRLRHGDEKNERRVYTGTPVKASHKTNYKTNWELRRLTKRTANCGVSQNEPQRLTKRTS